MKPRLLTIAAMARYAGISRQTIYTYLEKFPDALGPFLVREGKRTKLRESAAAVLYRLREEGKRRRGGGMRRLDRR